MAADDMEGEHVAPAEQVRQFLRGQLILVLQGLEIVVFRGLGDQAFVVGSPAFDIVAGIDFRQLFRGDGFIRVPHALQRVAQGEDRTGGFLQVAFVSLAVPFAVPPAVLLAVDDVRPFLLRRGAGNPQFDLSRLAVLLAVNTGHAQGAGAFLPRAEGSGQVLLCVLSLVLRFIGDGRLLTVQQFPADLLGVGTLRRDGDVHIVSDAGLLRGNGDGDLRQCGGTGGPEQHKAEESQQSFHQ